MGHWAVSQTGAPSSEPDAGWADTLMPLMSFLLPLGSQCIEPPVMARAPNHGRQPQTAARTHRGQKVGKSERHYAAGASASAGLMK